MHEHLMPAHARPDDAHEGAPPSPVGQHVAPWEPHAHVGVVPPSGTTHEIASWQVVPLHHASFRWPHSHVPLAPQLKFAPHACEGATQHGCSDAPHGTHVPLEHAIP